MTIKDDLHELVDELDEQAAREVLAYLRAIRELPSQPSPAFVEDTQRALDEALEPEAVRLPNTDVRAWLQTWHPRARGCQRETRCGRGTPAHGGTPCHEFVRVTWSPRGRRELDAEQHRIARDQPAAASRIAARIVVATDRLAAYPLYGRAAPWDVRHRLRELPVARDLTVLVLSALGTLAIGVGSLRRSVAA